MTPRVGARALPPQVARRPRLRQGVHAQHVVVSVLLLLLQWSFADGGGGGLTRRQGHLEVAGAAGGTSGRPAAETC